MPDIVEVEKRLRLQEIAMAAHHENVERLLKDVTFIREGMEKVSAITGKFEQISTIEKATTAAHHRLDEMSPMVTEHKMCKESREKETNTLLVLVHDVGVLQAEMKTVIKDDEGQKSFWVRRLEKFIDTAGPALLFGLLILIAIHFNGNSWTSDRSKTTSEDQNQRIMQLENDMKTVKPSGIKPALPLITTP